MYSVLTISKENNKQDFRRMELINLRLKIIFLYSLLSWCIISSSSIQFIWVRSSLLYSICATFTFFQYFCHLYIWEKEMTNWCYINQIEIQQNLENHEDISENELLIKVPGSAYSGENRTAAGYEESAGSIWIIFLGVSYGLKWVMIVRNFVLEASTEILLNAGLIQGYSNVNDSKFLCIFIIK